MTGTTFFFVLLGVTAAVANLMKLVEWLDTPREAARRAARPAVSREGADALARTELALERVKLAA
ncbi:MAG: hypothetical protein IJT71_00045 [Oscillospiraceae bacterium]|nr:hypothetical protein [Oscillospiraceae bacterium]